MPDNDGEGGRLCKGLARRQWTTVLGCGRRKRLVGQCWLETYTEAGEIFSIILNGHVGLRPVSPDMDGKQQVHLGTPPTIVQLSSEAEPSRCHWVADRADVYFYSQSALLAAFAYVPGFACNFMEILCAQHATVIESLGDPAPLGVRRLAQSLLARADRDDGQHPKVWVTQAELASETGLSRQWVNRLLRGLEKQGIAQLGRGYVVLCSPATLQDVL